MAYYDDTEKILCPYCGYELSTDDWYPEQDEETEVECNGCEKTYTISTSYIRNFTTYCGGRDEDGCEQQVYKLSGKISYSKDGKKIYVKCRNCKETKFVNPNEVIILKGQADYDW